MIQPQPGSGSPIHTAIHTSSTQPPPRQGSALCTILRASSPLTSYPLAHTSILPHSAPLPPPLFGDHGSAPGQQPYSIALLPSSSAADTYTRNAVIFKAKIQGLLPGHTLSWATRSYLPTLLPPSILLLRNFVNPHYAGAMLDPVTPATDLERAQGAVVLGFAACVPSVEELGSWFLSEAVPAGKLLGTRQDYDRSWRMYVTVALVLGCAFDAFPVTKRLLSAFITVLISFGYTGDTISTILAGIASRQRAYGGPPVLAYKEAAEWCKGLRKHLRKASPIKYPLRPVHLRLFAEIRDTTIYRLKLQLLHDRFMITLGTQGAMRLGELQHRDLCDWLIGSEFDDDGRCLGAVLNVGWQKQTQVPMLKRFAYGAAPQYCIIAMSLEYFAMAKLQVHPDCTKWQTSEGRHLPCLKCGRLFRKFVGHGIQRRGLHATSKTAVSLAISKLLQCVGEDAFAYTGKSMRKGGLTAAKKAGIPEDLRRAQSGHAGCSNRIYEMDSSPDEDAISPLLHDGPIMQEPRGGWSVPHKYLFSRVFHHHD